MALLEQTQNVIADVERLSGRKVVVQEDPSLPTLATIQTARGSAPFHFLRYRTTGDTTNYLIVYQLGFLVRMFSCPEGERWEIGSSAEEKREAIDGLGLDSLPEQLAPSLVDNIITQLRTYSVGMRVDAWILEGFPELAEEQKQSVSMQLAQNEQSLSPNIRSRFPKGILDANSGMNAAYAKFWGDRFGESRFALPYASLGYSDTADYLLKALEEISEAPDQDRLLMEKWGEVLNLSGYFHFRTHHFDE